MTTFCMDEDNLSIAYITELPDGAGFVLRIPLPVWIHRGSTGFVVNDVAVHRYCDGPTMADALEGCAQEVVDYFHTLEAHNDRLSRHMQGHYALLRSLLSPTPLLPST